MNRKCKNCRWFTWACPNWMCMNPEHPDFDAESDYPLIVKQDDSCELFEMKNSIFVDGILDKNANGLR